MFINLPHTLTAGQPENVNHVQNNLVAIRDVVNGNIDASNIADFSITSNELGTGSVTSPKVADGAITEAKIANGAITSAKRSAAVFGMNVAAGSLAVGLHAPVTITTTGRPVLLILRGNGRQIGATDSDLTVARGNPVQEFLFVSTVLIRIPAGGTRVYASTSGLMVPAAGTHTFYIEVSGAATSDGGWNLHAIEL